MDGAKHGRTRKLRGWEKHPLVGWISSLHQKRQGSTGNGKSYLSWGRCPHWPHTPTALNWLPRHGGTSKGQLASTAPSVHWSEGSIATTLKFIPQTDGPTYNHFGMALQNGNALPYQLLLDLIISPDENDGLQCTNLFFLLRSWLRTLYLIDLGPGFLVSSS